jgi:hypothetical protein
MSQPASTLSMMLIDKSRMNGRRKDGMQHRLVSGHSCLQQIPYYVRSGPRTKDNCISNICRQSQLSNKLGYFLQCEKSRETWRSWIRASWHNYENKQQDALYRLIYYSKSALHVSGDVFVHHQEQLTVFTVSGSIHPSCCWLVSWMSWNCAAITNKMHYID